MPDLVIKTISALGPLTVEVIATGGDQHEDRTIVLSSGQPQATVRNLDPGEYAVVATRPTGETLVRRVTLGKQGASVSFDVEGRSPHEFLTTAAMRGLVPSVPRHMADQKQSPLGALRSITGEPVFAASGGAGRSLRALATASLEGAAETSAERPRAYSLHRWDLLAERWHRVNGPLSFDLRPDYLRLALRAPAGVTAQAFALLDESGFGPLIVAPAFRDGLNVTFLAEGLAAEGSAERVLNPSALRVPVGIALPNNPRIADLLTGLNAPSLPGAGQIWKQDLEGANAGTRQALDLLLRKRRDLPAAVLGAHFLARFRPTDAPIPWLRNLTDLAPELADPPTLLAWRLIAEGSGKQGPKLRSAIQKTLQEAIRRPGCLFARTRAMLTQATRLYGPRPRSRQVGPTKRPRRFRPGDFLNVGADAGGLEAFWGSGPTQPGRPLKQPFISWLGQLVGLAGRSFVPWSSGGASQQHTA